MLVDFTKNLTLPFFCISRLALGSTKHLFNGTVDSSPMVKLPDHLAPSSAKASNAWSSAFIPPYTCDNFTLPYIKILKVQYFFL
jgi:hypothetical protein